eukprot:7379312-Pyramimonas_sp.AAC.1
MRAASSRLSSCQRLGARLDMAAESSCACDAWPGSCEGAWFLAGRAKTTAISSIGRVRKAGEEEE